MKRFDSLCNNDTIQRFPQSFHEDSPATLYRCPLEGIDVPGIDALMMGMSQTPAEKMDNQFADSIREKLFREEKGQQGMDLMALNIQRGRDHGMAGESHILMARNRQ